MNPKSVVVAKKRYRQHNVRMQAVIPKEKLLIYNVKGGGGGPLIGCRLKFSYFVGSRLKFSIFVGSRLNFLIFVGCRKISVDK